ncbi:hypothetical protein AB0E96_36290, partial [Kitasatospora sp. NPDC036755]
GGRQWMGWSSWVSVRSGSTRIGVSTRDRSSAVIAFDGRWTPRVFPVKERTEPTAWMAWSGLSSWRTPTVHLAHTIHAALAATGRRQRAMAWRARLATSRADLALAALAVALVLPGWLGYRILQLAGRW